MTEPTKPSLSAPLNPLPRGRCSECIAPAGPKYVTVCNSCGDKTINALTKRAAPSLEAPAPEPCDCGCGVMTYYVALPGYCKGHRTNLDGSPHSCLHAPPSLSREPAPPTPCADCKTPLDEGTAKVFTVCDGCWDKKYRPQSSSGTPANTPTSLESSEDLLLEADDWLRDEACREHLPATHDLVSRLASSLSQARAAADAYLEALRAVTRALGIADIEGNDWQRAAFRVAAVQGECSQARRELDEARRDIMARIENGIALHDKWNDALRELSEARAQIATLTADRP